MTLEEIFEPISHELHLVKDNLRGQLRTLLEHRDIHPSQHQTLDQIISHFLERAGKGLRPALVIFSANLIRPISLNDGLYQPLLQLATAVELIHSASLVHDDVLDDAQFRRGRLSINQKYGNKIAVLTGDMLFLQGFSLLIHLNVPDWRIKQEMFQVLCQTTQTMCFGEIFQHHLVIEEQTAEIDEYMKIIEHKTALLMSACCRCGAMLTTSDAGIVHTLTEFGLNFGLAFQLADDTADQDAVVHHDVDLRPMTRRYIERAKARLKSVNGNLMAGHLMALCDLLLPEMS
jgi:octaprenyl-diphosphate synthase